MAANMVFQNLLATDGAQMATDEMQSNDVILSVFIRAPSVAKSRLSGFEAASEQNIATNGRFRCISNKSFHEYRKQ